jgi:hypothetical protein
VISGGVRRVDAEEATICCRCNSCCAWRWAYTPETYRAITSSKINSNSVASSWSFYSQMLHSFNHKPTHSSKRQNWIIFWLLVLKWYLILYFKVVLF